MAAARGRLAAARDQLRHGLNDLSERLVAIYRSDSPDATTLLLDAEGFDDLATRAEYLRRIEEADAALVSRVRELRNDVADRLGEVEAAEAKAEAFVQRISAARDEIAAVRADAEARSAALADLRASRQAAIESLQSQIGKWAGEVERLERIPRGGPPARSAVAAAIRDPGSDRDLQVGRRLGGGETELGRRRRLRDPPSTWELYGGEAARRRLAGRAGEIAAQIWADSGGAAWVCAG